MYLRLQSLQVKSGFGKQNAEKNLYEHNIEMVFCYLY